MNTKFKLSLSAFLALSFSSQVLAIENEESYKLDTSVISATGYAQEIKNAPASISVIPKEEILNRPIRDLGDIVQEVPGVSTSVGKTGSNTISIRGMSSKYTLILVDGKRVNMSQDFDGNGFDSTSGFLPPPSMIERVEVIRGPASVIYGSDAMGGVINIITKKNPDKTTGSIALESRLQEHHNTWGNMYGINGNIFAPINDQISFNVRAKYYYGEKNRFYKRDIPGYVDTNPTNPYTSHSPTGYKNFSVGGRLNYTLDDFNSFYFDVDYGFQRFGSLNTSSRSVTAIKDYHKYNFILNHDGNYDFGKINQYLQYSNTQQVPHKNVEIGAGSGTPDRSSLTENQFGAYGLTFTKNFDFNNYGSLILNTGPYLSYEKLIVRKDGFSKDAYLGAIFGEGEYFFNDYVSTTAGARINYAQTYGIFPSPRLYVNFYPKDWLTFKAGVSSGLQVPSLKARYNGLYETDSAGIDYYGNEKLDAETTWNYEIGAIIETAWADFSLTGFYTDFKDAITTQSYTNGTTLPDGYGVCGGSECRIYENVGSATSQGIEFSIQSKALLTSLISRGIYIDFNYALTDTEQKSGQDKGKALNDIPKHNLSTKISYKAKDWDAYVRWIGKLKTPTDNEHTANVGPGAYFKDMHTVDLGLNYRFKNGITVGAVINNLFDQDFVDYVTYEGTRGPSYTNNYQRMIPGRNFWLTVRADF